MPRLAHFVYFMSKPCILQNFRSRKGRSRKTAEGEVQQSPSPQDSAVEQFNPQSLNPRSLRRWHRQAKACNGGIWADPLWQARSPRRPRRPSLLWPMVIVTECIPMLGNSGWRSKKLCWWYNTSKMSWYMSCWWNIHCTYVEGGCWHTEVCCSDYLTPTCKALNQFNRTFGCIWGISNLRQT